LAGGIVLIGYNDAHVKNLLYCSHLDSTSATTGGRQTIDNLTSNNCNKRLTVIHLLKHILYDFQLNRQSKMIMIQAKMFDSYAVKNQMPVQSLISSHWNKGTLSFSCNSSFEGSIGCCK
jgi:hypothetical protein